MRFISHRGNTDGVIKERENTPDYIDEAINKGFDVEIDIWCINKNLFLGHDKAEHRIDVSFLTERKNKLWCHAKNLEALEVLLEKGLHCFTHDTDDATLTSKNFVWTFPGKRQIRNSIVVVPERVDNKIVGTDYIGICSDFIFQWRELIQ